MNCEDYREAIGADPSGTSADGVTHAAQCDACRRYRDEIQALDVRIAAALAIDVPAFRMPELPLVADEGTVIGLPARRPAKASLPVWLGLAAGVLLAVFVGLQVLSPDLAQGGLAEQIIAHMDHEQASRTVTSVAVPEQAFHEVVDSEVLSMDREIGLVSYARNCVINGKSVPHLVIQGESGPVTLILMADEPVESAIPLSGDQVHGIIVPVGGGSVAIIGERPEQLREIDRIGERIVESVEWRI